MAAKDILSAKLAPSQPAAVESGTELLCDNYEHAASPVVGEVIGRDDRWVRLRIKELGREWLVRPDRIDLAKGTWQHVDADYPAIGADAKFDAEFRPLPTPKEDPKATAAIKDAAEKLRALLPEGMRKHVDDLASGVVDRLAGGPNGSVLARWTGKGTLDAPFVERKSKQLTRGASNGTEGWFSKASVEKYKQHFETL